MQKTDVFYLRKTSITFHVAVVSVSTLAFYRSSQGFTFKPTHRGVLICINTLVWISWVAPSHPKVAHRATRWSIRGWQLRCSKASNAKALRCIGCIASLTSALYKAKRRGNIQRQQDSTSKHFVTWEFVWHLDSQIMSRHVTSCHVMFRLITSHHVFSAQRWSYACTLAVFTSCSLVWQTCMPIRTNLHVLWFTLGLSITWTLINSMIFSFEQILSVFSWTFRCSNWR